MFRGARLRKLFLLCMALIVSLALCGAGFAYFSDTETIVGTITAGIWDVGGTIGFWKNWDKHNTYTQDEIEGWLTSIDGASGWLGPTTIEELEDILSQNCGQDMQCKFLKQYLATRLNVESGLLSLTSTHDLTSMDPTNYLGLANPKSAALSQIIAAIEGKYPDDPDAWPTKAQFEIMKNICDTLNNTGGIYPHR